MAAITKAFGRTRVGALPPLSPVSLPVKGNTIIVAGALVDKDANGYAVNAATNTTGKAMGVAQATVDTTGLADGAVSMDVHAGGWVFANSASTDLITIADVGLDCFVVDNNTVAKTSATSTRHVAGKVYAIEPDGSVVVDLRPLA